MAEKIIYRTSRSWKLGNYILLSDQIGVESDTMSYKIGDGITQWNNIKYKTYNGTILYINMLYV